MKNDLEGLQTIKIPSLNLRTNIDEINAFMANGTKKKKEILKMNLVYIIVHHFLLIYQKRLIFKI